VRHDSFICATWLIHMCNMTHSYVRQTHSCVRHDSFICAIPMMTPMMTHSYVRHDSFICVRHDSFICAIWLIHMCDMTYSPVWHDSICECLTWHVWMSHVTYMNESCHTNMSQINDQFLMRWAAYGWVMTHTNESSLNESWHICMSRHWMSHGTYAWVILCVWMSHVTRMNESYDTYVSQFSHQGWFRYWLAHESCHTCKSVMSRNRMSHVTHMIGWWMSHVTHVNVLHLTYEWVMSYMCHSSVTKFDSGSGWPSFSDTLEVLFSLLYVWHENAWFINFLWLLQMVIITTSYVWHGPLTCVPWLIDVCLMT